AAFLDADADRLRADRLAEAMAAIDHGEDRGLAQNLNPLVGDHHPLALPAEVARHPRHAVAVVAREVGGGEGPADALALGRRAASLMEDIAHELAEGGGPDCHHRLNVSSPWRLPRVPFTINERERQVLAGACGRSDAGGPASAAFRRGRGGRRRTRPP